LLIPFPTFESNLTPLIDSAHELHAGHVVEAAETLAEVHHRLKRFRRSLRHRQLAEFVEHALLACERGDESYALASLMSAFCHFIPEQAAA
jgi:cystathionine beta-lyase/cystathionine gamma-synthase